MVFNIINLFISHSQNFDPFGFEYHLTIFVVFPS